MERSERQFSPVKPGRSLVGPSEMRGSNFVHLGPLTPGPLSSFSVRELSLYDNEGTKKRRDEGKPMDSDKFHEHEGILNRAVALLSEDSGVVGIYLAGSFALGIPDEWSDIDLYIIVANGEVDRTRQRHFDLFGKVGQLLTLFPATHLGDPNQIVAFYHASSPIHVDYQYRAVGDLVPRRPDRDVKILVDRDGQLRKWRKACLATEETGGLGVERLQYLEDRFWAWCWYTHAKIQRGELWEARDGIEYMRTNVLVPLACAVAGVAYEGNRRVETKLESATKQQLEETIPKQHTRDGYEQALTNAMDLYEALFDSLPEAASIDRVDRRFFRNSLRRA
jgi:Nucleotidyltransferase domain